MVGNSRLPGSNVVGKKIQKWLWLVITKTFGKMKSKKNKSKTSDLFLVAIFWVAKQCMILWYEWTNKDILVVYCSELHSPNLFPASLACDFSPNLKLTLDFATPLTDTSCLRHCQSYISLSAAEWVMHVRVLECEYAHECSSACIPLCAVSVFVCLAAVGLREE